MSTYGSDYADFRRALKSENLTIIRSAARTLPRVDLADALAILPLIARSEPERYERAACRFVARLALERDVGLAQIGAAVEALNQLPHRPDAAGVLSQLARPI